MSSTAGANPTRGGESPRIGEVRKYYEDLIGFGPYSPIVPENRGGSKSRYVAAVLDAALLPLLEEDRGRLRLLDFGCGSGLFTVQVPAHAEPVVGIDVSMGLLEVGRRLSEERGRTVSWVQIDGHHLPFADCAFNRIVARESLCHVHDSVVADTLAELARVLEPGGRFYLLDQVSESPGWQRPLDPPWQKKRSFVELVDLFGKAGLDLESAVAVRQPRFPWIYLFWFHLLPSFLIPPLARLEVGWNRRFCRPRTSRWQDDLLVFRRRSDED